MPKLRAAALIEPVAPIASSSSALPGPKATSAAGRNRPLRWRSWWPLLPRAQLVVFPVDCISHNAMHVTRQLAERAGIPCHPLRSASVGSFVDLMRRLDSQQG
jgi:hypothetical protein